MINHKEHATSLKLITNELGARVGIPKEGFVTLGEDTQNFWYIRGQYQKGKLFPKGTKLTRLRSGQPELAGLILELD